MFSILIVFLAFAFSPVLSWACASCGCTLSSDWEQSSTTGFKFDLRYDYINQSQLRSETSSISPQAASKLLSSGNPQEVETYTKNNYITATSEYSFNSSWKLSLQLPYIMRKHSTLGTASDGYTAGTGGGQYDSETSNLGDAKLISRFQGFNEEHDFGVLFGLKLATGSHSLTGNSTDTANSGPVAIDRGLQPGSGTTDLIVGAYFNQAMSKSWDYFGEGIYQTALGEKDAYKPGSALNFSFGFRYFGVEFMTPQLQINARYVEHDTGANADTVSTGGTIAYLSPGVGVPIGGSGVELYTFLQLPIFQNLFGVQLAPTYTFSLGARYLF